MIGILIATHGKFAEGLLNAVELIAGKQENVKTIGLYHGDGIDEFYEKIRNAYEELDQGEGVLALVDILGGSPANMLMKLMSEKQEVLAITGVNMPMLVEAVMMREGQTVQTLCETCLKTGTEGQLLLHEKYKELCTETKNEEEF